MYKIYAFKLIVDIVEISLWSIYINLNLIKKQLIFSLSNIEIYA